MLSPTPSSLPGKAVQYALFVVGRKNWLFSNTPRGAHSSALLYSLLETAKANGINPAEYLLKLLEVLPVTGKSKDDLEKLLPWNLSS